MMKMQVIHKSQRNGIYPQSYFHISLQKSSRQFLIAFQIIRSLYRYAATIPTPTIPFPTIRPPRVQTTPPLSPPYKEFALGITADYNEISPRLNESTKAALYRTGGSTSTPHLLLCAGREAQRNARVCLKRRARGVR